MCPGGRLVRSGSSASFGSVLGVGGIVRVRVWVRPGGRWVRLGSHGCALRVVGFIHMGPLHPVTA